MAGNSTRAGIPTLNSLALYTGLATVAEKQLVNRIIRLRGRCSAYIEHSFLYRWAYVCLRVGGAISEQKYQEKKMRFENINADAETLTEVEAARMLGISKITLQRLRHRGEISHFRIGARVLYSPQHLKDYLTGVERKKNAQGGGE
jgi:excisionase family DNA binding protein